MTYLYIILTLVFILQLIITVFFLFVMNRSSKKIMDIYQIIPFLRKLQDEGRIKITGDHGIQFIPTFNSIIDKDRTLLKIDMTAINTRWVINDPKILESIEKENLKDIQNLDKESF